MVYFACSCATFSLEETTTYQGDTPYLNFAVTGSVFIGDTGTRFAVHIVHSNFYNHKEAT